MKEYPLKIKSYSFTLRIIRLYKYLQNEKQEFVLSKQALRSGKAIGALISEPRFGQSKADFLSKISIALKEASETDYWLPLLKHSSYIDEKLYENLYNDVNELISMLVSTVKTSKIKAKI